MYGKPREIERKRRRKVAEARRLDRLRGPQRVHLEQARGLLARAQAKGVPPEQWLEALKAAARLSPCLS